MKTCRILDTIAVTLVIGCIIALAASWLGGHILIALHNLNFNF